MGKSTLHACQVVSSGLDAVFISMVFWCHVSQQHLSDFLQGLWIEGVGEAHFRQNEKDILFISRLLLVFSLWSLCIIQGSMCQDDLSWRRTCQQGC